MNLKPINISSLDRDLRYLVDQINLRLKTIVEDGATAEDIAELQALINTLTANYVTITGQIAQINSDVSGLIGRITVGSVNSDYDITYSNQGDITTEK